jgi:LysM repeat protein
LTPGVPLAPDALGQVTGTAQPGDRILLYDGARKIGEAQADADGNWRLTLPELAPGRHALWAQVVRPDGSIAAASRITLLRVAEGTEPPTPTPTPETLPRVSAPYVPGLTPGRPMPPGELTEMSGVAQPGETVLLFDGAMRIGEARADENGNWRIELSGLPLGTHGLWVQVVGPDGEIVAFSPLTVVTIGEPEAQPTAGPAGSTGASAQPQRQVDAPALPAELQNAILPPDTPGEITGAAQPGERLFVYDGGLRIGEVVADTDGNWRFALPPMAPGPHGLWVQIPGQDSQPTAASPVLVIRVAAPDAVSETETTQSSGDSENTSSSVPPSKAETAPPPASAPSGKPPARSAPRCKVMYTVKRGDTLANIAWAYHTTATHLARINNISNPDLIITGSTLCISGAPPRRSAGFLHTVVPGDTLGDLGWKYGWTALFLARVNGIRNPDLIFPGQVLFIPAKK